MSNAQGVSGVRQVWYAAYGSNLLAERFGYYIKGGTMPGRSVAHAGARDRTPPSDDRPWRVSHQLAFGGNSARWQDSGVAFVDSLPGSGEAVVRLWKVTAEQFADIAAQENRMSPGDLAVDIDQVTEAGAIEVVAGGYSHIMHCGDVDGVPVMTFTAVEARELNAPGPAYLGVVGRGLLECGLSDTQAATYLLAAPGVCERWTYDQVLAELAQ